MIVKGHGAKIHSVSVLPKKEANTKNNMFFQDYDIVSLRAAALRVLCKSRPPSSLDRRDQPQPFQRTEHNRKSVA
jgi:hypothetical protein